MPFSIYQASVPVLARALNNLAAVLAKGAAHAETKRFDPTVLLGMRLTPDMFPLTRQVQIATDVAKACPARLTGQEPPSWPDDEATFAELEARIRKAVAFLDTFPAERIDGSEDRLVTLKVRGESLRMTGRDYLFQFVLPNVYFHVTTSYALLRHAGVELGKPDYIGALRTA